MAAACWRYKQTAPNHFVNFCLSDFFNVAVRVRWFYSVL